MDTKQYKGAKDEKSALNVGEKRKLAEDTSSPVTMKIGKKPTQPVISMKVGQMKSTEVQKKKVDIISKPKKGSVAAAFNNESDDEEEIPREAKMRMRNLGKDTATSSGPNSFNKSKKGFINYGKLKEKEMKLVKDKHELKE